MSLTKKIVIISILILLLPAAYLLTACAAGPGDHMHEEPAAAESEAVEPKAVDHSQSHDHPVNKAKVDEANERADQEQLLAEEEARYKSDSIKDSDVATELSTDHPDCN